MSSYLWPGEGHTFLAATWIGMVVWLGSSASDVAERTTKAGIVVCYVLGQVVKAMFLGGNEVWSSFWIGLVVSVKDSVGSPASTVYPPVYLDYFYVAYWPRSWPSGVVPTFVAASSLAVSFGLAAFEARRGRSVPLWSVLWIIGLMAACSLTFLISEGPPLSHCAVRVRSPRPVLFLSHAVPEDDASANVAGGGGQALGAFAWAAGRCRGRLLVLR